MDPSIWMIWKHYLMLSSAFLTPWIVGRSSLSCCQQWFIRSKYCWKSTDEQTPGACLTWSLSPDCSLLTITQGFWDPHGTSNVRSSHIMTPNENISHAFVGFSPSNSSGASHLGFMAAIELLFNESSRILDRLKSDILATPSELRSIFGLFKSLWMIELAWR